MNVISLHLKRPLIFNIKLLVTFYQKLLSGANTTLYFVEESSWRQKRVKSTSYQRGFTNVSSTSTIKVVPRWIKLDCATSIYQYCHCINVIVQTLNQRLINQRCFHVESTLTFRNVNVGFQVVGISRSNLTWTVVALTGWPWAQYRAKKP